MKLDLQLFGGRGASSSRTGRGKGSQIATFTREEVRKAYETMREKMQMHMDRGDERWSASEYTNAEFLAHMEDANWHGEMRQLMDAKITQEELTKIKNKTTLSPYGVGSMLTGKENVEKMINSVRQSKSAGSYNPKIASEILEMKKGGMNYATAVNYYKSNYNTSLKKAEENVKKYWGLKTGRVGNRNFYVVSKAPKGFTKEDETSKYTIYSDKNNNRVLVKK